MKRFLYVTPIFLLGIAFAQNGITFDLGQWATDLSVLTGVVVAIVGFVRTRLWKTLDGIAVNAVSIVTGAVLGAVLHFTGYFPELTGGLLYGFQAGIASFIGVDAVRQVFRRGSSSEGGTLPR